MRKLLLFFAMLCVSVGTWAAQIGSGSGTYVVADGVVTFSGTTAGEINQNWSSLNFSGATRIKFDNTCEINKADLENFLKNNTYYVDLFDITNGDGAKMKVDDYTTTADDSNADNIDMIIEAAVADMVSNGWQAKGIILPLNTGSGTTKVEKPMSLYGDTHPTFTEYAVYYRSTQEVAAIYAHDTDIKYTYPSSGNTKAQTNFNTAYAHLTAHSEVAADTYIVSTNNDRRLDLSSIPSGKTKISIINDEMVYRSTLANIYVETAEVDKFAEAVANTGIKNTPCELLVVEGPVSGDDVKAVNDFNDSSVQGPKVYNFAATTGATKEMLSTITNGKLEYIVLPNAMATEQIVASDFSSSLTNLKTALAPSANKTKLSAYVKQAGSLGMARYYATGGTYNQYLTPQYNPSVTGLTDVILSGNLNAGDINVNGKVGADGHWGNSNVATAGLNSEYPASLDLEKAVFANQEDMNFANAMSSKSALTSIVLPTSSAMDLIPDNCLNGFSGLTEICIPYNFKYIRSGAFDGTQIDHITTTDASGALIDNGDHTWTLSANVQELGTKPSEDGVFVNQVFQHDLLVTDIYILATKAPKCYAGVFPANASYGYGGASGSDTYCRDKYFNSEDRQSKAWIVLRFPSEASYNAAKAADQATDATYEEMKANYTDPTRVYTKKEQTGAVDANGDEISWPTRQEANRSYNQGSRGLTWNAWDTTSGSASQGEDGAIAGGAEPKGAATGSKATNDGMPTTTSGYTFNADYMGWHQIALAMATYYEPAEVIENEKIVREYEEAGWYTFCIPFNMSYKQVVEMLGVPKSTGDVINKLDGEEVTSDIMPDIRQLSSVTRKAAANGKPNIVMLRMTNNLWEATTPGYTAYLQITHNTNSETHQLVNADPYNSSNTIDDRLSLIGGRPYIIKAYKRKQVVDGVDQFKIKGQNLGKYVLERYADQFGIESSIVQNTKYESYECYEQLGSGDLQSLRFAKPYEDHRVQAVRDGEDGAYLTYETDENGQLKTKKYYYTMVGQFWQQPLPQYCLYMSKGNWYRYTNVPENIEDRYTWDPYKCIIMATEEVTGTKGAGYRDDSKSNYPEPKAGTTDLLESDFYLGFLDGRDDDDFDGNGTHAKYMFMLDDDIIETDEEGNVVTAINQLDGEMVATPADTKVYNMAGQYVGNSLQGLSKGMYIMSGKKIIVK
ncbi:MAG: hypothetical protein J5932_05915 [Prevotella sp.]|nr:hypothetical protein [Prevotella sp.]